MSIANEMEMEFDSIPENEGFARVAVSAFFTQLDPTLEEVCDVKTAVSEAVTNAIIHGYNEEVHKVKIKCSVHVEERVFELMVIDEGCGIVDIKRAMEPLYTTKSEMERAGMGFAFMEAFMDSIEVESKIGIGTTVKMTKIVRKESEAEEPWIKQSL
ncbi:MAG: anti-sigma F factor [Eubacteriales bacterium]